MSFPTHTGVITRPVEAVLLAGACLTTFLLSPAKAIGLNAISIASNNFYTINTESLGSPAFVGTLPVWGELVNAGNDHVFVVDRGTDQILTYDVATRTVVDSIPLDQDLQIPRRGFDRSPIDGFLYGVLPGMQLRRVDPSTGKSTLLAPITGAARVEALAFSPAGTLFAFGSLNDNYTSETLFTLDIGNGTLSRVKEAIVPDADTMTYGSDGFIYACDSVSNTTISDLYQVNPISGSVRNLGGSGVFNVGGLSPLVPSTVVLNVSSGTARLSDLGYRELCWGINVAKSGTGVLVLDNTNWHTGTTSLQSGRVLLADGSGLASSKVQVGQGASLLLGSGVSARVASLSLSNGGLVDLHTGTLVVEAGLSPFNSYASLYAGRSGGTWSGTAGVTSSAAAASGGSRTVGWLDNGNGSVTFAYAAPGDSNLDWTVDILDVVKLTNSGKFNSGLPATWIEGDFNYDGFFDIGDIADFMSVGLFDAGHYNRPAGAIAAVPEPGVLGFVGIGAGVLALMVMRQKRTG